MLANWLSASRLALGHLEEARRKPAPIVFLDQRWSHHGSHSGYLVGNGLGPSVPRNDRILPHPLSRYWTRRSGDPDWEHRLLTAWWLHLSRAAVMHIVDGDFDKWVYRRRIGWLRTKLTATFHQPVDQLENVTRDLRPGMLDAIVCVSRNQIDYLKAFVPEGRCVFVPHGVDTEFFADAQSEPVSSDASAPMLLAVGVHRRDFATLVEAARIIRARRPEVRVQLIGPESKVAQVGRDGTVETKSNVSDAGLRAAYRESAMLFLPLEEATANNALLESMACGRPAVVSDLPALRDYTAEDAAIFCPRGDAQAHADAALRLIDDPSLRLRMGQAARARSQEFAWPRVRGTLAAFLRSTCEP